MKTVNEIVEAKSFVVKRSHWTGRDDYYPIGPDGERLARNNGLWLEDDNKCCLGFYAEACGYVKHELAGRGMPYFGKPINTFLGVEAILWTGASLAARINDAPNLTQAEREAKLIDLFGKHGITLTFMD